MPARRPPRHPVRDPDRVIEYWSTRDGRRLRTPIDLKDLGLTSQDEPHCNVDEHRAPGTVAVHVAGERKLYAVDLRTGRESEDLRLTFREDLLVARSALLGPLPDEICPA
ncbi:hypothetical protein [Streptomyces globisporus]|uniref:hypothetical protein n=1 Tax=Streptomyces globisporus TaxID=1908 RepID=UPI0014055162|nr:hypothetical protein [Streptomyces globisporus]